MRTTVTIIQAEGPLTRKVWTFYNLTGFEFVLDNYREESRPSPRHTFRIDRHWNRVGGFRIGSIPVRPTVPESVEAETLAIITSLISVK